MRMVAPLVARLSGVRIELGDKPVGSVPSHLPHRLIYGRELRPCGSRNLRIVEPGNGNISRHREAEIACRGNCGNRHIVILRQDCRRAGRACENLSRDLISDIESEVAGRDQPVVDCNPGIVKGSPIALHAAEARGMGWVAENDADAPVPEREKMRGNRMAGAGLIHRDHDAPVELPVGCHPGVGKLLPLEHVEQRWLVARRRRKHDAIEPRAKQQSSELLRPARDMIEWKNYEPITPLLQAFERAILQFDDITRARAFIGEADEIGSARDQALRDKIGMIVERGRGFLHPLPHRLAHMGSIVESTGNGFGRDARNARDIDDRGSLGNLPLPSSRGRFDAARLRAILRLIAADLTCVDGRQ